MQRIFLVAVLWLACPMLSTSLQLSSDPIAPRRQMLQTLGGGIASTWIGARFIEQPAFADDTAGMNSRSTMNVAAYQVIPDQGPNLNPTLQSLNPADLFRQVSSQGGALWLGEHHNSAKDHAMQAQILTSIHEARQNHPGKTKLDAPVAIGLEQVEVQFQPVLDDYSAGKLTSSQLRQGVEWDKRWTWPFELYEPVFEKARAYGMPLIALNVNTEDLAFVEADGLPGLPRDRMRAYIADTTGFARFASTRAFSTYIDYVVLPSYEMHAALGLLRYSRNGQPLQQEMSFRNFLSGRILWDEAMASRAAAWTRANPGGLLVGLVGADHVKFRNGIPGRYARIKATEQQQSDQESVVNTGCTSILLNPTLIDSRPSGTVGMEGADSSHPDTITLQLRYLKDDIDRNSPDRSLASSTGGVLPLADYLLIG